MENIKNYIRRYIFARNGYNDEVIVSKVMACNPKNTYEAREILRAVLKLN